MRRSWLLSSVIFSLAAAACSPVETIAPGTCGNAVIEDGEDCDTHESQGFDCKPPGEEWQCSFVCEEGRCPAGYGCGTDDVCRKATGDIEPVPFAEVASQARELLSGDFDADRRMDVVGVEPGRARVHFLGASGDVQQVSFSGSFRPAIGKMGALPRDPEESAEPGTDLTDDLCQSLDVGIGASLSEGDRTFTAKTYASISVSAPPTLGFSVTDALPIAFDALPGDASSGDETGAIIEPTLTGEKEPLSLGIFVNFGGGSVKTVLRVKDGRPQNLAGFPVTGNFDEGDDCEEIVIPIKAGPGVLPALRVYSPCVKAEGKAGYEWRSATVPTDGLRAEIQTIRPVAGPVFDFDVNGDGHLDLLITVELGPVTSLEVAYGVGDGSFHSTSPPPPAMGPLPAGDDKSSSYAGLPDGQKPLALGDLDDNGYPDLVTPTKVLLGAPDLNKPGELILGTAFLSARSWTEAVIADMNGNGSPDVVASAAGAPNIDLLNANLYEPFNPLEISTNGTVRELTVGDFDGDLVNDIAFQDALSPEESFLMIAYGRTAGGPEEAVEAGRFSAIEHIVTGNVHVFGVDNITDLGVASENAAGAKTTSFFPGNGNRVVQSPFLLTEPSGLVHAPLLTSLGFLRERPEGELHNDVAILATVPVEIDAGDSLEVAFEKLTSAQRVWGLRGTGDAEFDTFGSVFCEMPRGAFFFPGFEQASAITVSAAQAGERGRVFVAAPRAALFLDQGKAEVGSILVEALFDEESCTILDAENPAFAGAGEMLYRVRAVHLNDNDEPEILAVLRSFDPDELGKQLASVGEGGPPIKPTKSRLVVFWDGVLGSGGEMAPITPVDQPDGVNDYAVGDLDGDGIPEVLVAGEERTVVYSLAPDGGSLVLGRGLSIGDRGADGILVADADGDGVNDVVMARGGLRFFKGVPKAEVTTTTDGAE